MQTILLTSLGSPGDINPFIAIAIALKERGWHPVFLANPFDVPAIERCGIDTRPVGRSWDLISLVASDPKYLLSPQAGIHTTRDIFIPYAERLYPETLAAIDALSPVAVVSHAFCYGSAWAAKARNIPSVVAHLAPISLLTEDVFNIYPPMKRLLFRVAMPLGKAQFNGLVKPLCDSLGVPWHKHIIEETMLSQDLLLGLWSKQFADLNAMTLHADRITCGFPTLRQDQPARRALDAFLADGEPPLAVTLGTNAFAFAKNFFHHAQNTAAKLGLRMVIICPKPMPGALPRTVIQISNADYSTLFPQCRAVIHHGGIGVTAETLKAGVPAIVVPFGHDQQDNALRAVKLGTARTVPRNQSERQLTSAVAKVLSQETAQRARDVGAGINSEMNGADYAAEFLSNWLTGRRRAAS